MRNTKTGEIGTLETALVGKALLAAEATGGDPDVSGVPFKKTRYD